MKMRVLFVFVCEVDEENPEFWRAQARATLSSALRRKLNTDVAKNVVLFLGDGESVRRAKSHRRPSENVTKLRNIMPLMSVSTSIFNYL